jgi:RNA recognition motif-containing protein
MAANYVPGAIGNILGKPKSAEVASSNLSTIFSDNSIEKFARVAKPVEFAPKRKPVEVDIKVKKPKHKHSKPNSDNVDDKSINESSTDNVSDINKNRTVFVGNVPISATVKSITRLFREYGEVESVRFRSIPYAGTAVDDDGNTDLVKKVCAFSKKFGDQKGSFNAYVVFKNESSVPLALKANNTVIDERHIRVDRCTPSMSDPKKTVFVGSLHYYADEEQLREHFATVSRHIE